MTAEAAPHFVTSLGDAGSATAASVLSFGAAVAGFALGWCSLAADYTVNFPADCNKLKVFLYVYAGLNIPLVLIECLGAAMSELAFFYTRLIVSVSNITGLAGRSARLNKLLIFFTFFF